MSLPAGSAPHPVRGTSAAGVHLNAGEGKTNAHLTGSNMALHVHPISRINTHNVRITFLFEISTRLLAVKSHSIRDGSKL